MKRSKKTLYIVLWQLFTLKIEWHEVFGYKNASIPSSTAEKLVLLLRTIVNRTKYIFRKNSKWNILVFVFAVLLFLFNVVPRNNSAILQLRTGYEKARCTPRQPSRLEREHHERQQNLLRSVWLGGCSGAVDCLKSVVRPPVSLLGTVCRLAVLRKPGGARKPILFQTNALRHLENRYSHGGYYQQLRTGSSSSWRRTKKNA